MGGSQRLERLTAAKAEAKALRAWEASDQTDPRPPTDNLDSIRSNYEKDNPMTLAETTSMTRPQLVAELKAHGDYDGCSRLGVNGLREQVTLARQARDIAAGWPASLAGQPEPELCEHRFEILPTPTDEGDATMATKTKSIPQPQRGRAECALELKSAKHARVIFAALEAVEFPEYRIEPAEGSTKVHHLTFRNADAQAVLDVLAEAATASTHIYDTRLLVASAVMLRRRFPKVTQTKRTATARLVDGLIAQDAAGEIFGWDVTVKIDGSLIFEVVTAQGTMLGGVRWMAEALGIAIKGAEAA